MIWQKPSGRFGKINIRSEPHMYHFEYVPESQTKPVKKELLVIIYAVQDLLRDKFTFRFDFIGSSARNMITQDVKSNIGFDFDINIEVNDPEDTYRAEELRHLIRNALDRVAPRYGYSCAEDSTRVLTIKKKNVFLSRIEHSCDFAIVHNYIDEDGIHRQQYIRYNKQTRRYVWETQPAGYRQLIEKADWLRHHGYWKEVKSLYLEKKNYNTDPSKRSRALYAETVNEICMRHSFNK